jgi:molybdopterin-guanine dinucleotide biosynthesis protein A
MTRTLGAVLAGGHGSRLGLDVPKALARLGGMTLLERAAVALETLCDERVVVVRRGMSLPTPSRVRVVEDPIGMRGPLAGLVSALETCSFDRAIVLAVDFPFVRPAMLRQLLERLGESPAVVPAPDGVPQPLVAAYAPAAGPALFGCLRAGERSATAAVLSLDPLILDDRAIEALDGGASSFFNLNTPADLAEAESRIAKCPA